MAALQLPRPTFSPGYFTTYSFTIYITNYKFNRVHRRRHLFRIISKVDAHLSRLIKAMNQKLLFF